MLEIAQRGDLGRRGTRLIPGRQAQALGRHDQRGHRREPLIEHRLVPLIVRLCQLGLDQGAQRLDFVVTRLGRLAGGMLLEALVSLGQLEQRSHQGFVGNPALLLDGLKVPRLRRIGKLSAAWAKLRSSAML